MMKSTQIKLIHTSTAPDMSVPMIQYNLYSKKKYENTTNKLALQIIQTSSNIKITYCYEQTFYKKENEPKTRQANQQIETTTTHHLLQNDVLKLVLELTITLGKIRNRAYNTYKDSASTSYDSPTSAGRPPDTQNATSARPSSHATGTFHWYQ